MTEKKKCAWCTCNDKMEKYHDTEWGVPLFDDRLQFEYLMLEVMQCGLNWNMMLQKREIFRRCFAEFDFNAVAGFTEADIECILATEGMIRSRRKVEAVIHNARVFCDIVREFGSFCDYLWGFTDRRMLIYKSHIGNMPAKNELSERISRDLKKRKMKYMGAITVYSHLQACGIINDHDPECFRFAEVTKGIQTEHPSGI